MEEKDREGRREGGEMKGGKRRRRERDKGGGGERGQEIEGGRERIERG